MEQDPPGIDKAAGRSAARAQRSDLSQSAKVGKTSEFFKNSEVWKRIK